MCWCKVCPGAVPAHIHTKKVFTLVCFLAWGVSWFVVAWLRGAALSKEHGGDPFRCGHSLGSVKPTLWRTALPFCSLVRGADVGTGGEGCAWGARQRNLLFRLEPAMLKLISLMNPSG